MFAISAPAAPPPENGAKRPKFKRSYTTFYHDDDDAIQVATDLFAKLDSDSSSFLENLELKRTRDLMLGNAASFNEHQETLAGLLSGMDLDNDGRVDKTEWNEFMRSLYEIAGRRRFLVFTEAMCKSADGHAFSLNAESATQEELAAIGWPRTQAGLEKSSDLGRDLSKLGKPSTFDRERMYNKAIVGGRSAAAIVEGHMPAEVKEHPAVSSTCPVKPPAGNDKIVQPASNEKIVRRRTSKTLTRRVTEQANPSPSLLDALPLVSTSSTQEDRKASAGGSKPNSRTLPNGKIVAVRSLSPNPIRAVHQSGGQAETSKDRAVHVFQTQRSQLKNSCDSLANALGSLSAKHSNAPAALPSIARTAAGNSKQSDQFTFSDNATTTSSHIRPSTASAGDQSDSLGLNMIANLKDWSSINLQRTTSAPSNATVPTIRVDDKAVVEETASALLSKVDHSKVEHQDVDSSHQEPRLNAFLMPSEEETLPANDSQGSILDLHAIPDRARRKRHSHSSLTIPGENESWPEDLIARGRSNSFDVARSPRSRSPSMPCINEMKGMSHKKAISVCSRAIHACATGKQSPQKQARSPEGEPEPEAPTFGEPRKPSKRSDRSRQPSQDLSRSPHAGFHDEKWLQRHLDKEMHLLSMDEVFEIMTHREGSSSYTHVDLSDILEIFLTAKKKGLDMHLAQLVPQHNFDHWAAPEDLSGDELLHLFTILESCEDFSELSETFVREHMAPVRELCRTDQMKESVFERVDKEAFLDVKQWRHLVPLLSMLMRIDMEYILAIFAWVVTGHFEMTDILAATIMLACSPRPPKKAQDLEEEIAGYALDLNVLYDEGFGQAGLVRLCTGCGVFDPEGKKGLSTKKITQIITDCQSRMQELIGNRCEAFKRKRTSTVCRASLSHRRTSTELDHSPRASQIHKDSNGHKDLHGLTGRTEFSILVETTLRALPKADKFGGSPLLFCLHFLQQSTLSDK